MGFLNFISGGRARGGSFSGGSLAPSASSGAIAVDRALAPTMPGAITPANPGPLATVRSVPILDRPRYFSREESASLKQLASQRRQQIGSSKSAYKSLRQLAKGDAVIHSEHRAYEATEARGELKKKKADARLLKALHGLRPGYAAIPESLGLASDRASMQIDADRQQRLARQEQFRTRLGQR